MSRTNLLSIDFQTATLWLFYLPSPTLDLGATHIGGFAAVESDIQPGQSSFKCYGAEEAKHCFPGI